MIVTIDTEKRTLKTEDGTTRELELFSPEAFEVISREWVRVGWALRFYHTFSWFGQPILQLPEDLVRLQETICRLKPDVILETGIFRGGSLLFHATLCEAIGKGRVIGVDLKIDDDTRRVLSEHRLAGRIRILEGDSTAPSIVESVRNMIGKDETVLVILDSGHSAAHVAKELQVWSEFVSDGFCIIATDGIMRDLTDVPGGDPTWKDDNPAAAAHDFLRNHPEFEMRDPEWLTHGNILDKNVTYWPDAWLWKKPHATK